MVIITNRITIEETDKISTLEFDILHVDVCIVNSLRRTIINNIDSIVFRGFPHDKNKINIITNTTKFHNEYIKHRVSNIPIYFNKVNNFEMFTKQCEYRLNITNNSDKHITITSNDLILYQNNKQVKNNCLPKYKNEGIPICKLFPSLNKSDDKESLEMIIKPDIGNSGDNSCWNMTSKCVFYNNKDDNKIKEIEKTIDPESLTDFRILDSQRYFKPNEFHFIVKTIGVYNNETIIKIACNNIIIQLNKFIDILNKKEPIVNTFPENDELIKLSKENNGNDIKYTLKLENDDSTFGVLIEKHLSLDKFKYVSFVKKHPHDSFSYVDFILDNLTDDDNVYTILINSINIIIEEYVTIRNSFV